MAEQKAKVVKVGRGGPRGPRPKVQNPGKIFMRILRYVMECYRIQVVAVVICISVSVFANVQGTLFMQTLIDGYILPLLKEQSSDFSGLAHAIARTAGFYGIGIVTAFAQARMMAYVTQGTLKRLRDEMFTHMQTLPIKYFDRNAHGDIMSLYTNDIDTLRQMISQSMPQLLNSAITVVSVLVSMVVLSVPLTVLTLVMVGIMLLVTKYLTTNSSKYFVSQQRDIGAVNGYIEEMMNGQKVVKVFCHEEEAIEQFDKLNDQLFESADKANRYSNLGGPANTQLGNLSYVFCAMIGGALALSGMTGLTLGKLASFLTFNRTLNMPISQISMQFNAIIMALAGGQRIFDLLDEKPEVDEGKVMLVNAKRLPDDSVTETKERTNLWAWKRVNADGSADYRELKGDIVFKDVDFGYDPGKIVLHDINLYGRPGQKIAFVGSTGAGKTTITNLINRFYDIQKGTIEYDGIDVTHIHKDDLRASLGIVLQDTHLFTGTVRDNIRYGKPDATDEEIIAAAKNANAHEFIMQLPDGYNTDIGQRGVKLSGGQKQRLSLARVFLKNPPILIFDEATSALDNESEKIVQDSLEHLAKNRTTLVIAHRLSTIRNAKRILVLTEDGIAEEGTHDELMAKNGVYANFYHIQGVTA